MLFDKENNKQLWCDLDNLIKNSRLQASSIPVSDIFGIPDFPWFGIYGELTHNNERIGVFWGRDEIDIKVNGICITSNDSSYPRLVIAYACQEKELTVLYSYRKLLRNNALIIVRPDEWKSYNIYNR